MLIGREKSIPFLQKIVQESPADQTEALLLTEDSSLTRFAKSSVHQHVAEKNRTLILRVVKDKRIAVLTTNRLSRSSLRDLLRKAISITEVQHPNEDFVSLPTPQSIPEINTFHENIKSLTPNRKVKLINDLFKMVRGKGLRASGAFSNGEVEVAVVNSLGVEAYQRYSDLVFHLIVEKDGGSGYASYVSRDPAQLDIDSLAKEAIEKSIQLTKDYNNYFLTVLVAYNGVDEMVEAVKNIAKSRNAEITSDLIKENLWTGDLPPVDLLIRTGGEPHNSTGFMMWHTANTQFYFTKTLWPDFDKKEFKKAIEEYGERERRFGV